jgi:hypothetical protein
MTDTTGAPRRSPDPCCDGCPGWAVFEVNRCAVHGEDCQCEQDDCSTLELEACDGCWHGVPDPPGDAYYAEHPVCIAALAARRAAERAQ